MTKTPISLTRQLLWLVAAAILAFSLFHLLVHWSFSYSIVFIQIQKIEFDAPWYLIIFPLFLLISLLIFLVKEFRFKYSRSLPNVVLLVSGILLVIFLSLLHGVFPLQFGWTEYPPLSALDGGDDGYTQFVVSNTIFYIIPVIQAIVVLALLHVAYNWGNRKIKPDQ